MRANLASRVLACLTSMGTWVYSLEFMQKGCAWWPMFVISSEGKEETGRFLGFTGKLTYQVSVRGGISENSGLERWLS